MKTLSTKFKETVYKLLSEDTLPCLVKRIGEQKRTRNKCWLVQFLDGRITAIVNYTRYGAGGAVIVVSDKNNPDKDKAGYFHQIEEVDISYTALKKYFKNNNYHQVNFSIFQ